MTGTTPHFEIPYPERSDQIRLIPDQMQAMAAKTDTELYRSRAQFAFDPASLPIDDAANGQMAFIATSAESEMSKAGPYYYYGRKWVRAAFPALLFDLIQNDDWALETWQWQSHGQPHMYIRAKAKRDIAVTASNREWRIGTFTEDAYKPPTYAHFPAYTNAAHAANFGFQVSGGGLTVETFVTGFTFKQNNIVFAQLTWPCASLGQTRKAITN